MESMIQAAHQHLSDASPRSSSAQTTRRQRTNQEEVVRSPRPRSRIDTSVSEPEVKPNVVRLADHMDGFPLVPLPLIPQLGLADLEQVERGLLELLGSLRPHESDQQLGKYAGRQLSLVQRQLTQQRAQERVLQLLRGDLPVALAPIAPPALKKSLSASTTTPIFLTPRSAPSYSASTSSSPRDKPKSGVRAHASTASLPRAPRSPPIINSDGAGNRQWKSKKAAVQMARAMVRAKATTTTTAVSTTGFVIISNGASSRKRRRQRVPTKLSAEEETQRHTRQLERDREHRRQAAYQRLMARQELQAKKQQARQKKGGHNEALVGRQDRLESDSESESDVSDVSNCSESDEANEKAIQAIEVQIQPADEDDDEGDSGSLSETEDIKEGGGGDEDGGVGAIDDPEEQDGDPERNDQGNISTDLIERSADLVENGTATSSPATSRPSSRASSATEAEETEQVHQESAKVIRLPLENDGDEDEKQATELQSRQEEEIAHDLQLFMATRMAAKLEQLQAEKKARATTRTASSTPSPRDVTQEELHMSSSINDPPASHGNEAVNTDESEAREDAVIVDASQDTRQTEVNVVTFSTSTLHNEQMAGDLQQAQSWVDDIRQAPVESTTCNQISMKKTLGLPRAPMAACKDYRSYFSNFHCILTSVFEQCHLHSSSNSSSSTSLYHRPVGAGGEHTLRLQLKLYESWQSIMQDYATVFGPKIAAPEGMVPAAAVTPWTPHYRINSTARKEVCDIVTDALKCLGGDWEEHPSGLGLKTTWNLLWTWSKPRVERQTLLTWQKVNHFQHAKALTRKDCLKKHIGKYLAAGGRLRQAFDIIPPTFLLPKEYVAFVQAFQARGERLRESGVAEGRNVWIMKPVALSRGRGISLVNDLSQVIYGDQVVVQEYIARPRLLDGFKFDLRLYVLVTSFNPLEAFLYDEGFVRLCTRPYEDGDLTNLFVHLTNSSIQKDNQDAIAGSANPIASAMAETDTGSRSSSNSGSKHGSSSLENEIQGSGASQSEAGGTKTTLAYLWRRLEAEGADVAQVKRNIDEVVLKALLCGEDHIPFQVNSFDLLGYDILLDVDLRPWLIEINSSPSMARDNDLDFQVKDAMMLDTLRVVDPLHFDRAKLAEVIARRQHDLEAEKRRPHANMRHPREAEELAARQLNEDLTAVLRGRLPRAYGELPEALGNYRRLCPHTSAYNQLVKLKRSCLRATDRKG